MGRGTSLLVFSEKRLIFSKSASGRSPARVIPAHGNLNSAEWERDYLLTVFPLTRTLYQSVFLP